ncbi:MAG: glutathione S-transferase C-terminal domain-containing protein, partial [Verrucomicrobiae bacterium]|nr:glutathione S-transferase C-terminal domain-containing protein [Verrucomicrobiae bacterium]
SLLAEFYEKVDAFKGSLESNPFLFGEAPVYADYALYGVIGNVHYIPANRRMEGREWLEHWMDRLKQYRLK